MRGDWLLSRRKCDGSLKCFSWKPPQLNVLHDMLGDIYVKKKGEDYNVIKDKMKISL